MTLLELLQVNVTLKRVARTNGGEYAGPCPSCGGRDRFRVWPNHNEGTGGRFWCRRCGKQGDAVDFLRDTRGLSFQEACLELGQEPSLKRPREHHEDRKKPSPSLKWQERAGAFLARTQGALKTNRAALDWLRGRGLRSETIEGAGLGWTPVDRYEDRETWGLEPLQDEKGNVKRLWLPGGLVNPLRVARAVVRLRIRRPAGDPRYVIVSGSDMGPMIFHPERECLVIVESELDGLLI